MQRNSQSSLAPLVCVAIKHKRFWLTVGLAVWMCAAAVPAAAIVSDDFNSFNLDTGIWEYVDPGEDGTLEMTGANTADAWANLSVPAGSPHRVWTDGIAAPRLRQPAANADFEVEVKFESDVAFVPDATTRYKEQGIVVEQDADNFIRFEFFSTGTQTFIFAATLTGPGPPPLSSSIKVNQSITITAPMYMRVAYTAATNAWLLTYSADGMNWNTPTGGSFSHPLAVTAIGPYGANEPGGDSPDHTASIDYFFDTAAPLTDDGAVVTDTTGPLIYNESDTVGPTTLQVDWKTDELATGTVEYGLTMAYELGSQSHPGTSISHSVLISGLDPNTTYNYRIVSEDGSANSSASPNFQVTTPGSAIESDDFNTCALDPRWTFVDPLTVGSFALVGAGSGDSHLELTVPAGTIYNAWGTSGNESLRVMQAADDVSFRIEAKFNAEPLGSVNDQGLIIEQDANNWLRFDVFRLNSSSQPNGFAGKTIGGTTGTLLNSPIPLGSGLYLAVERAGDDWILEHSADGSSWTSFHSFTQVLTVTQVGVFAANAGGAAYTAEVDYLFDTAAPIDPEDNGAPIDCIDGNVCTDDVCTAGSCSNPAGNAGAVCRSSAGECDPQETCTGASTTCPVDVKSPSGTACTDDGNECTNDQCDGASDVCQHPNKSAGSACGSPSDTDCDNPDTCNGSGACVTNNEANGSACGDQGVDCRVDDTCQAGACQDNGLAATGSACGSAADTDCDDPDTCDAAGACQANNEANGSACGDQGVECLVDDTCQAGACQDNGFASSGSACGSSSDTDCDNPDTCNGSGACATNNEANGSACGDQGVECLVDDTCQTGACQDNGFASSGSACGSAADTDCDDPDTCDAAGACLANNEADGSACGDQGVDCRVDDSCQAGACQDNGIAAAGSACGSAADTDCDDPDTCDAAGACQANNEADGSACGDQGVDCLVDDTCQTGACQDNGLAASGSACGSAADTDCDDPDTCDAAGACQANNEADGSACGDQGVECLVDDSCQAGACQDNGIAASGSACGSAADTDCDDPDTCDAAGLCQANNEADGSACGDQGVDCLIDDACQAGACQDNGIAASGSACGSAADTDCDDPDTCDAAGLCQANNEPSGLECTDEPDICTDDLCDGAGVCEHIFDPSNDQSCVTTTTTLPPAADCPQLPETLCLTAEKGQLQVKNNVNDAKDQLKWKWQRGQELLQADLGNPVSATTYALCVYDHTADAPLLVASLIIDPNFAWLSKAPKGLKYKDKAGLEDGVQKVTIKTGDAGKSKVIVKAKGVNLPTPVPLGGGEYFDQDTKVVVQLGNTEGKCWTSEFTSAKKNTEEQYKAKQP